MKVNFNAQNSFKGTCTVGKTPKERYATAKLIASTVEPSQIESTARSLKEIADSIAEQTNEDTYLRISPRRNDGFDPRFGLYSRSITIYKKDGDDNPYNDPCVAQLSGPYSEPIDEISKSVRDIIVEQAVENCNNGTTVRHYVRPNEIGRVLNILS